MNKFYKVSFSLSRKLGSPPAFNVAFVALVCPCNVNRLLFSIVLMWLFCLRIILYWTLFQPNSLRSSNFLTLLWNLSLSSWRLSGKYQIRLWRDFREKLIDNNYAFNEWMLCHYKYETCDKISIVIVLLIQLHVAYSLVFYVVFDIIVCLFVLFIFSRKPNWTKK